MRNTSRFEYKYILSKAQYYAVKNALMPYIEKDFYTKHAENHRYLVRSLYFDTHSLKAFHERNDGQYGRIKIRLRVYQDTFNEDGLLSVELKTKKGMAMTKYSTLIPLNSYNTFLEKGIFNEMDDHPVVAEFLRLKAARSLEPQLIVQYLREGYQPKAPGNLRITFDHSVSSSRANTLFPQNILLRPHRPKNVILEIKCQSSQPDWLRKIVKTHNLKIITNSKYVQGIEVIRPNMITPNVDITLRSKLFKSTPKEVKTW